MGIGVVNHDNCVIHVAEVLLHPGLNVLDSGVADRVLANPHFQDYVASGRLEVLRTRGAIRSAAPEEEGDKRNFALEELGEKVRELRRQAVSENEDAFRIQYRLLMQHGGMTESEVIRYIAQFYGLDVEAVRARVYA